MYHLSCVTIALLITLLFKGSTLIKRADRLLDFEKDNNSYICSKIRIFEMASDGHL